MIESEGFERVDQIIDAITGANEYGRTIGTRQASRITLIRRIALLIRHPLEHGQDDQEKEKPQQQEDVEIHGLPFEVGAGGATRRHAVRTGTQEME